MLALTSVGATLVLTGCGADPAPRAGSSAPSVASAPSSGSTPASSAPSPSASATPSVSASARAGRPSAAHRPHQRQKVDRFRLGLRTSARSAAAAHLLDAARLPSVAGATWTQADPGDRPAAVGACQKTGLEPIGAVEEVRRRFTAPGGLSATEVVARFADDRSAWQAHRVLVAWRDDCEQRVSGASVGPIEPVVVPVGSGDGYRTTSTRARTAGLAILRTGSWITLVEVTSRSAYPQRWDPARVTLRRAARTF